MVFAFVLTSGAFGQPVPKPRPVMAGDCVTVETIIDRLKVSAEQNNITIERIRHFSAAETKRWQKIYSDHVKGAVHPLVMASNGMSSVHGPGVVFHLFFKDGCMVFAMRVNSNAFNKLINKISLNRA